MVEKPKPPPAAAPPHLRLRLLAAAAIALAVLLTYGNSLSVPFLFDDQINITDNPYIRLTRLSPDQLRRAMVQDRNQVRPFSNLSFGLDYYFHHLDPRAMHLENIALHAMAALLLFALLLRLWPEREEDEEKRFVIAAAIGAAAWALSPVHTQAVTYLVQRHTLMASTFLLLSVYCWVRGRQVLRGRSIWFAGALAAFIVAAGSKESGFLTPLFWMLSEPLLRSGSAPSARVNRRVVAAGAGMVLTGAAVLAGVLYLNGMFDGFIAAYRELGYGPLARLATEARVALSYLATIVLPLPARLALDHEVIVSTGLFSPWTTAPAVGAVAAALLLALVLYRIKPGVSVAIFGFLLALAPESTLIPVELMNDHRMYLAAAFVTAPLAAWLALNLPARRSWPVLLAVLALLSSLTHLRNRTWQDPARLWADSARKSPSLYRPWSNLCGALTAAGQYRFALHACEKAIGSNPPGPMPLINHAIAIMGLGTRERAGEEFSGAASRWPDSALARLNYGAWLFAAGRDGEAMAEVSKAISLDQFLASAYLLRARIAVRQGNVAQARADLALLLRLYPENQEARALMEENR